MEKKRCSWCEGDDLYEAYHDLEWGRPLRHDQGLFEFVILESFQAGLSWITILRKREDFRDAFDGFDPKRVANYSPAKVQELLENPGIVRNKLKVNAAIGNAQAFLKVQKEHGSFSKYIWGFVGDTPIQHRYKTYKDAPANTHISDIISKDLKKRGFKFMGSTVVYAFMQAIGMVNDHETDCHRFQPLKNH